MFDTSSNNPLIPTFLRFVSAVECSVVFSAAVLLFFFPAAARDLWAWDIPPYNARFVGSIYFAAYVPLIIFWSNRRWVPGRLVLWLIFVFTAAVMLVMFVHWRAFDWSRAAAFLVFLPLYVFLPLNSALHLFWYRHQIVSPSARMPSAWRIVLLGMSLLLGGYGLGLLIAPVQAAGFWLWEVDAFHGRIYASAFLTPALGCWWLARRGETPSELLVMGLNLFTGGFLTLAGTLLTSMASSPERQVDLAAPGAWVFILMYVLIAVVGAALTARALAVARSRSGLL